MDYTGLDYRGRLDFKDAYKINRPIKDEEKHSALPKKTASGLLPLSWYSILKVNNTYLEVVDRWYLPKGIGNFFGLILLALGVGGAVFIIVELMPDDIFMASIMLLFSLIFIGASYFVALMLGREMFRLTHYPIRFNRKNRKVYVMRPGVPTLTVNWDDLLCHTVDSTMGAEVRALVLSEDKETVLDTFTLLYATYGNINGVTQMWEYVRRYMEEPDGVKQAYEGAGFCPPVSERKETFLEGLFFSSALIPTFPIGLLLVGWFTSLQAVGRWIAMKTCKLPVWPEDIEAECYVEPEDPLVKDWRNALQPTLKEWILYIVPNLISSAAMIAFVAWLLQELW